MQGSVSLLAGHAGLCISLTWACTALYLSYLGIQGSLSLLPGHAGLGWLWPAVLVGWADADGPLADYAALQPLLAGILFVAPANCKC